MAAHLKLATVQAATPPGRPTPAADAVGGVAVFDPNGYYSPVREMRFGALRLFWFELTTLSYLRDGHLDYEHPVLLQPGSTLRLARGREEDSKWLNYDTKDLSVSPEGLVVTWRDTEIGTVVIRGRFLYAGGRFWDRPDIQSNETIVLRGAVTFKGQRSKQVKADFTFWEGD